MNSIIHSENNDPKFKTFFTLNETILQEEDLKVEYKNFKLPLNVNPQNLKGNDRDSDKLVTTLKKLFCGFLNSLGGRVYLGINDNRVVVGCRLSPKQKDETRNQLVNLTKEFHPKCRTEKIKVEFLNVKNMKGDFIDHLYVIKIIVKRGNENKLYSITSNGFISYMRLPGQCVEMSAIEIEKEIVDRSLKVISNIIEDDFCDPPAEKYFPILKFVNEELGGLPNYIEEKNNLNNNISNENNLKNNFIPKRRKSLGVRKNHHHSNNSNIYRSNSNNHDLISSNILNNQNNNKIVFSPQNELKEKSNTNFNNNTEEDKKIKLSNRKEKENILNLKSISVLISNLPDDIDFKEVSDLVSEFELDTHHNLIILKDPKTKCKLAKLFTNNYDEAIRLKLKLDGLEIKDKQLHVTIVK